VPYNTGIRSADARYGTMRYDVLIVGGGPGGLHAGRRLAEAGFAVALFEEHRTIGEPVHCTGILALEAFDEFDLPRDAIVNPLMRAEFYSPSGLQLEYETTTRDAFVVERQLFDRGLARQADAAGVDLRSGERVADLKIERDGVVARLADGRHVRGRVAVLACGANYVLQRRLGLGFPSAYLHSAQLELLARRPGCVELYFGHDAAPAGFGWIAPVLRPDGASARVGVMCRRDALTHFGRMFDRVAARWGLTRPCVAPRRKLLPLGPIDRTYGDRVVAIGDAAGLVKPTTGGGIYYSLVSAGVAAGVLADGLRRDDLSAALLRRYEAGWQDRLAGEIAAQAHLRGLAERLTDAEIDALFDLAQTDGVMPIVRKTARFNQHRQLILALLRHPPARRILFRTLVG